MEYKGRQNIVLILFIIFASFLIWKIASLQILKGEYFKALAIGQEKDFFKRTILKRGKIFLSDKTQLTFQKEKFYLFVFPKKIKDLDIVFPLIKDYLGKREKKFLVEKKDFKLEIPKSLFETLKNKKIVGLKLERRIVRFYPFGDFAGKVLGFVNLEGNGQYGIEEFYDEILKPKTLTREKFPYNYLEGFSQKEKGADLYLTINYNIQNFAQELLKKAKKNWEIEAGQIIVINPQTGEILALVDYPSFDPSQYQKIENLEIFLNSCYQKLFEPGSLFKPITFAAGLQEKKITPATIYEDKGCLNLGGLPICNFERRIWGRQTMTDVLQESINTGAVFVEQELGKEKFLEYLEKFGFFEKTGIDLPGEVFSENKLLKRGYPRDLASASFGQGIEVTPLQLTTAFSAIATGGTLLTPYLVKKIVFPDGKEILRKPKIKRRVIDPEVSKKLTTMLISVVREGSARRAKIDGYYIAGKTGTAQVPLKEGGYSKEKTIQSFIGYFPAFDPKFLILVKLDNPKKVKVSAYSAVPLFRELAKYIINLFEIPPDY